MALYINHNGNLKEVKEKPFKLEKDIQKVFEANLNDIMGLELVKSEFIQVPHFSVKLVNFLVSHFAKCEISAIFGHEKA